MNTRTRRPAPLSLTFALTLAASTASAAPFVASAPEAGIRLSLEAAGGDAVRGTLLYEGLRMPVEGVLSRRPDGFALRGFVVAEGERIPFMALRSGASVLVEGDGERAQLRVEREGDLLARRSGRERAPRRDRAVAPADRSSRGREAGRGSARGASRGASGPARRFAVRDPQMGGAVAYTFEVPAGWRSEGEVRWAGGKVLFPQLVVKLESPDGIILEHLPTLFGPADQPPPANIGAWLASMIERAAPDIRAARVIAQARDHAAEARDRQSVGDIGVTHHHVTLGFEKAGIPYRSEAVFGYQRLPAPTLAGPPRYKWSLQFQYVVSAPERLASRVAPIARRVFGSRRANPRWEAAAQAHIRRQQGRARQDDAQIMAAIRENGRRSSEALDSGMSSWRRREAMRDRGQERIVDGIREESAWRRPGGGRVKLPSAYDHAYETPRGDWVVSEAPLDDAYLTPLEAE